MAAKKMFPPGEIDSVLNMTYDEVKLQIEVRILCQTNRNAVFRSCRMGSDEQRGREKASSHAHGEGQ